MAVLNYKLGAPKFIQLKRAEELFQLRGRPGGGQQVALDQVDPALQHQLQGPLVLDPLGPQALKNLEAVEVYRLVREK